MTPDARTWTRGCNASSNSPAPIVLPPIPIICFVATLPDGAVQDGTIGLIYRLIVRPEERALKLENRLNLLSPGMAGGVEVKTGARRLIE